MVALIEALKGALALLVGFGLLSLAHQDAQQIAEQWVAHSISIPAPVILAFSLSWLDK
jgi:hypothetical protein